MSHRFVARLRAGALMALALLAAPATLMAQDAMAQEKVLVNVDKQGLALQGYDPVSFFSDAKPLKGSDQHQARYQGATYYFATAENQASFEADPARYAPQFGGYCAWAASRGYTAKVEINTAQVVGGRLILNYNTDVQKRFNADLQENLAKADKNWPGIVEKEGKAGQ